MGEKRSNGMPMQCGLAAALISVALLFSPAHGAEVYASSGPDGPRFSSQALDHSYALVFREPDSSALAILATPRSVTTSQQQLRPLIAQAAARHGLPTELVDAVVAVESGYNAQAISPRGARGAMQLMPATARHYGLRHLSQLHEPELNIDAGARHLKDMLARHGGNVPLALAAYNAGAGSVQRHGTRIPPHTETMLYVPAVLSRAASVHRP